MTSVSSSVSLSKSSSVEETFNKAPRAPTTPIEISGGSSSVAASTTTQSMTQAVAVDAFETISTALNASNKPVADSHGVNQLDVNRRQPSSSSANSVSLSTTSSISFNTLAPSAPLLPFMAFHSANCLYLDEQAEKLAKKQASAQLTYEPVDSNTQMYPVLSSAAPSTLTNVRDVQTIVGQLKKLLKKSKDAEEVDDGFTLIESTNVEEYLEILRNAANLNSCQIQILIPDILNAVVKECDTDETGPIEEILDLFNYKLSVDLDFQPIFQSQRYEDLYKLIRANTNLWFIRTNINLPGTEPIYLPTTYFKNQRVDLDLRQQIILACLEHPNYAKGLESADRLDYRSQLKDIILTPTTVYGEVIRKLASKIFKEIEPFRCQQLVSSGFLLSKQIPMWSGNFSSTDINSRREVIGDCLKRTPLGEYRKILALLNDPASDSYSYDFSAPAASDVLQQMLLDRSRTEKDFKQWMQAYGRHGPAFESLATKYLGELRKEFDKTDRGSVNYNKLRENSELLCSLLTLANQYKIDFSMDVVINGNSARLHTWAGIEWLAKTQKQAEILRTWREERAKKLQDS